MLTSLLVTIAFTAPPTLGDGLRAIDAFGPPTVSARFEAPAEPPRTGPKIAIATGAAMVMAGLIGALLSSGCNTQDAEGRCLDARAGDDRYPSLMVLGLGVTMTGTYWYRRQRVDEAP